MYRDNNAIIRKIIKKYSSEKNNLKHVGEYRKVITSMK